MSKINEATQDPSDEGKNRLPPNGLYDGYPCTCKPECPRDCKGQCGCKACNVAYNDDQSNDYD